jgi:hypothetical protein
MDIQPLVEKLKKLFGCTVYRVRDIDRNTELSINPAMSIVDRGNPAR